MFNFKIKMDSLNNRERVAIDLKINIFEKIENGVRFEMIASKYI